MFQNDGGRNGEVNGPWADQLKLDMRGFVILLYQLFFMFGIFHNRKFKRLNLKLISFYIQNNLNVFISYKMKENHYLK